VHLGFIIHVCKDTALNREFCDFQFQSAFWRQVVGIYYRIGVQKIQMKYISIECRALPVFSCRGHVGMYIYLNEQIFKI